MTASGKITIFLWLLSFLSLVPLSFGQEANQNFDQVAEKSFVWQIESPTENKNTLYLGGTIHVLSAKDYPLPRAFDVAYAAADSIVLEMDLGVQSSPEFQLQMMTALFYQDGQRLDTVLEGKTWGKLRRWCESNAMPLETFKPMKPGLAAITITLTELMKLGLNQQGVDSYYYQKALADNKVLQGLETGEQQLAFLAAMGQNKPDALIEQTLMEVDDIRTIFPQVKSAWRTGNAEQLDRLVVAPMLKQYPEVYQMLLTERNKQWLASIESDIQDSDIEFVLVGAAHLVGKEGLLAMLKAKGYQIRQM